MSEQTLAHLLKEARDFDDFRKVADELERRFASNEELSKAFVNAAAVTELQDLARRVRDLESQLRGSAADQSFHGDGEPADPRPPTRPASEPNSRVSRGGHGISNPLVGGSNPSGRAWFSQQADSGELSLVGYRICVRQGIRRYRDARPTVTVPRDVVVSFGRAA